MACPTHILRRRTARLFGPGEGDRSAHTTVPSQITRLHAKKNVAFRFSFREQLRTGDTGRLKWRERRKGGGRNDPNTTDGRGRTLTRLEVVAVRGFRLCLAEIRTKNENTNNKINRTKKKTRQNYFSCWGFDRPEEEPAIGAFRRYFLPPCNANSPPATRFRTSGQGKRRACAVVTSLFQRE